MSVPGEYWELVQVWGMCRGGLAGRTILPCAGGALDQPAVLIDALDVMEAFREQMRSEK